MVATLLSVAWLSAPPALTTPKLPPAHEIVEEALRRYRSAEDRTLLGDPLIQALVDLGRDEEALEVARTEKEFAESRLTRVYLPRLARRLGRVPDEDVLRQFVETGSRERDIALGRIARALAAAGRPDAAEETLARISDGEPGPINRALAAAVIADAYHRAGDEASERRMVRFGLGEALRSGPDFFVMENLGLPLTARAAALGEHDALRKLLDAAVTEAEEPDGLLRAVPGYEARFWARLGRFRAALGDRDGAEAAFDTAARYTTRSDSAAEGDEATLRDLTFLAAEQRLAGFTERTERTTRAVVRRLRALENPAPFGYLRNAVWAISSAGELVTAVAVVDAVDDPMFRILARSDIARAAVLNGDPSAREYAAAALAELEQGREAKALRDRLLDPIDLTLEVAVANAAAGETEAARRLIRRAARRAERARGDAENFLVRVVDRATEARLLEEAWATLLKIPADSEAYARGLAVVAAGVAEHEAGHAK